MGAGANDRRIELSVSREGDSLRGFARDLSGETREFLGWLGLFSALDALLAAPGSAPKSALTTENT